MKTLQTILIVLLTTVISLAMLGQIETSKQKQQQESNIETILPDVIRPHSVLQNIHFDISARLSEMMSFEKQDALMTAEVHEPLKPKPYNENDFPGVKVEDTVIQHEVAATRGSVPPIVELEFSGINREDIAAKYYPPDPNGDVGPNHYFQIVNSEFAIWDKSGNKLLGNMPNKTIWEGFDDGQPFDNRNGVDPIVLYDEYADRWLIGVLIVPPDDAPEGYILVAISTGPDPTGSYYRYAFAYDSVWADYPKLGVWHDGFYMTANEFTTSKPQRWVGASLSVFDRDAMINGNTTASMIYFKLGNSEGSLLPADADGILGTTDSIPHMCLSLDYHYNNILKLFTTITRWDTIELSAITIDTVPVASYSNPSNNIPQPGTAQTLASLGYRLMHRLQYRDFGGYRTLVANHTVSGYPSRYVCIRWYELRDTGDGFDVYQQGTFSPDDAIHRWMGSIAMNGNGDIALGYSVSNATDVYPSIRFTGQSAGAPVGLGVFDRQETSIIEGENSQTGTHRWGDYSMMAVDPSDDYTFWYTQEYTSGGYDWLTRIAKIDLNTLVVADAVELPFHEDWETQDGMIQTDGNVYSGVGYYWAFETDNQDEGRFRWGANAFQMHTGNGAMTLDKHPNNGDYATNNAILTLNLSDYTSTTNLELSFWWADHKDENHAEDKVWIRGSMDDPWVEIYDLDPSSETDHVYHQVTGLDIDSLLAEASQTVGYFFQVRFGQKDNSFAPGDGLSFDDIIITGDRQPVTLPFLEEWETSSGTRKTDGNIYEGSNYHWNFETDTPDEGRVRWGADAYQAYQEAGALTLDKHPNTGTYAVNNAILTLDLSRYAGSSDLLLSFWWADHNDEDQAEDKVWIRGSDTDIWVEFYDLDPASVTDHVYRQVRALDIDAALSAASQMATSTFQLRFGQKDNSFAPGDGLSFDNINIEEGLLFTAPYFENFDAYTDFPEYWSKIQTSSSYPRVVLDSKNASSIPKCISLYSRGVTTKAFLISPYLEGLSENGGVIEFSAKCSGFTQNAALSIGTMSNPQDTNTFDLFGTVYLNDYYTKYTLGLEIDINPAAFLAFKSDSEYFIYIDDFYYDELPDCFWPLHQKTINVTSSTADLSWSPTGTATSWEIAYDASGFVLDTTSLQTVTSTPFTVTGLMPDSEYEWYIRSVCGESDKSDWRGPFTFRTNCSGSFMAPLAENFDDTDAGDIPDCWRVINTNPQEFEAKVTTTKDHSPPHAFYFDIGEHSQVDYGPLMLISPMLDDLTGQDRQLSFFARYEEDVYSIAAIIPTISIGTMTDPYDLSTYSVYKEIGISDVYSEYNVNFDTAYHLSDQYIALKSHPRIGFKYGGSSKTYFDDLLYTEINEDPLQAVTLPFVEGFESANGERKNSGKMFYQADRKWDFYLGLDYEMHTYWGTYCDNPYAGDGALTMNARVIEDSPTGDAILTLNMENYAASIDLNLSFNCLFSDYYYNLDQRDTVYVRGSKDDDWLVLYALDVDALQEDIYYSILDLDIDSVLSLASQTSSSSFQLRFNFSEVGFTSGDKIYYDNIMIHEGLTPAILPFIEGWETEDGVIQTGGNIYSGIGYNWEYETDNPNEGRLRYGTNAYQVRDGVGAMTLDKHPNDGDYATSYVTLNLDLSAYATSTDLELSFWWADHADEEHAEDKVWIRGSDADPWIEIYDLYPESAADGAFQFVSGLDIDAVLSGASQAVGSGCQLRFGQKDNSFAPGDGLSFDNITIKESTPLVFTLPFLEDWESENGTRKFNGNVYTATGYSWDFETDNRWDGRLRWGTDAYQAYVGGGAMTLDKHPNDGDYATNFVTLTLDLSAYTGSPDLELSFWWADHADEDHAEDKVWIRGSDTDAWVEIFDLDPAAAADHVYQQVTGLDIDTALLGASQIPTGTFQLRFGQKDNSFTPGDGLSFDDISIIENMSVAYTLPFLEDWETETGTTKINGNVYSASGYSWDFQNDNPNEGRLRWGADTYLAYEGSGAMTLDKHPNDGDYATNFIILTLDLSDYTSSTDLELSFWWADHADEDQPEDKVWIRGSDTDSWVDIYDLDPSSATDHVYQQVTGLDIDAVLLGASQIPTGTFQLRFGQKDNSFAPGDGLSFDNIAVEEIAPPKMLVFNRESDLLKVYPNPFSRSTTISFRVPETRSTTLKVYDLRGNEVARLFEGIAEGATEYRFTFYGESHRNGIYTIHLQSGKDMHLVKKVLLNK